ncbi:hypothetical protein QJQ45_023503 [Haematococcus lacustris]|nr:hypothetical protein QJQ45_023503 [Haematococcus lacustris]
MTVPAAPGDDFLVNRRVGYAATLKTAPAYSFGGRYGPACDDTGPGPGQYSASEPWSPTTASKNSTRHCSPNRHSTSAPDSCSHPLSSQRGTSPMALPPEGHRPGGYLHRPVAEHLAGHGVVSQERSPPAYTMPCKVYPPKPDATPGPLDYLPRDSMRRSAPAFSLHGANLVLPRNISPGPGHYSSHDVFKTLKPACVAYSMGAKAQGPSRFEKRPGPAEYSPTFKPRDIPAASIKFRHPLSPGPDTPAPHDYQSPYLPSKSRSGGKSFGIRHLVFTREVVPGPQYAVGASTLGIAAEHELRHSKLPEKVVL